MRQYIAALALFGCAATIDETSADDPTSEPVTIEAAAPDVYLSDLPPSAFSGVRNGWGPMERDTSNGEAAADDGLPITLNGVVYAKGLGCRGGAEPHVSGTAFEAHVALGGKYDWFTTDVGLDDETGSAGRVALQVYVDGALVASSGVMLPTSATQRFRIYVAGKNDLKLVATNGGVDGKNHGDWAGARLTPRPPLLVGSVNGVKSPAVPFIAAYRTLGLKSIRSWFPVDWKTPPTASSFSTFKTYHDQGFSLVVAFSSRDSYVPTALETTTWFKAAAAAANQCNGSCIDYWEMNNEPNYTKYFGGKATDVINNIMKPAYAVLHASNLKVVGAATDSLSYFKQQLLPLGYLSYCDIVGFHPYAATAAEVIDITRQVRGLIGTKPLFLTELNTHSWNYPNASYDAAWAAIIPTMIDGVKSYAQGAWYYGTAVNTTEGSGRAGLFNVVGAPAYLSPHEPFYSAFKSRL